jgi:outer membrane protein OmpA-like peptidoglycan-associated protein
MDGCILACALTAILVATVPNATACEHEGDSLHPQQILLQTQLRPKSERFHLTIQNVDIKYYPEVSLIVEAVDANGDPLDTLSVNDLVILENGLEKQVLSVKKLSIRERVPVDIVIVLDVTATMQVHINAVRDNITQFIRSLVARGIDYRLALVLFSDVIEKVYPFTSDVNEFVSWVSRVRAWGGFDEKENALEALRQATKLEFRPSANRVAILITDAPYHQLGERGNGRTDLTTQTAVEMLQRAELRTFCIAPLVLTQYDTIAKATRGVMFDIGQPFARILNAYSTQLTNLFAITYRTDLPAIPDSINVAILNQRRQELVRKTIPVVELGRKLIIENLLFETASAALPDHVPELEVLAQFMKNNPRVVIRVEGHTDNRGARWFNKQLSHARAESVKDYLVKKKGIASNRILTVGYGDMRPIADNTTEFGRSLNRRTEVVIVSK